MKKLIALLLSVITAGTASAYMLDNHAEMQAALPTSYAEEDEPLIVGVKDAKQDKLTITFSQKKNFYDKDIDVAITCSDTSADIYYTTDGNDPGDWATKYTGKITLKAGKEEKCTTIKAVAIKDGMQSDVTVKSYIVGKNVFKRFSEDTLVFVLSADEYDLYDYYHGIAVEGYLRDQYIKNDYDGYSEINPDAPANYNIRGRAGERPMYVEVYSNTGEELISQAAGARVAGGWSRANSQKSWRLIARKEYDPDNGKFKYPFFTDNTDAEGLFLTKYDRITLRDGANDREFGGVREELSAVLANDAGFPDTQAVRPAAVYLNGKYYGYSWLHEAFSEDYLEMMYGGNKDNYRIIGSKELEMESDDPEDKQALAEWDKVIKLAQGDLTNEANFKEFCSLVDIDDLMLYYAMEIYVDNKDWPGNNFKVWRYYPSKGEKVTSKYLDGKWRFLFYDAEFAWGLYENGYSDDTLYEVKEFDHMQGGSSILNGLMKRDDMRRRFAQTICELEAGAFSPEHVKARLDELVTVSEKEQLYALENGYTSEWSNEGIFRYNHDLIRDYADKRPAVMDKSIKNNFGFEVKKYAVNVKAPTGASVKLGSMELASGENASVLYFNVCKPTLTAEPYEGYAFDYWEVNGKKVTTKKLSLSSANASNSNINVKLHLKKVKTSGTVTVTKLYTAGDADYIVITNTTSKTVSLKGMHLSDKASKPDKFTIKNVSIKAGKSVTFVLQNNKDKSALAKYKTNFSLKTGETLYFTDKKNNVIASVPVLELKKGKALVLGADGKYHIKKA